MFLAQSHMKVPDYAVLVCYFILMLAVGGYFSALCVK